MTNMGSPLDTHFDDLLVRIKSRIAAQEARKRKQRRWGIVAAAGVSVVALTGGALAVVQASEKGKTVSLCYASVDASAGATEVSAAPVDGTVDPITDMAARVQLAEDQCAAAWRIGVFSDEGPSATAMVTVPTLFTCVEDDGRLAVYPADGRTTCDDLGDEEP